jgi:quinoprotein glucose dehydrogenase
VRYTSPYDFMQSPTNGMTAIGPPWSEITAYDLNTGEIKWRIPDGGVTAPAEAKLPPNTGAHMPRGGPLATAGDCCSSQRRRTEQFVPTIARQGRLCGARICRRIRRRAATYEVGGRQFIVFRLRLVQDSFRRAFGGPAPARGAAPAAAPANGPEAQAARGGAVVAAGRGGAAPAPVPTSHTRCRKNRS